MARLKGEYTFGLNALMERFKPPFIPQFYGVVESLSRQSADSMASLRQVANRPDCTIFIGDERAKEGLPFPFIFVPLTVGNDMREIVGWWKRWCNFGERGMRDATVALDLGVQVGSWMGFNPIYMLGCELTEDRRRGYEDVQKSRESASVVARMLAERGIQLINLSEGCTAAMPTGKFGDIV